jgi:hypothetical protein
VSEALLVAVRAGDVPEAERLLDADASPDAAFHAAAEHGPVTIVELLERPVIRDPSFRDAVAAIHAGDVPALGLADDLRPLLATATPELLVERGARIDVRDTLWNGTPREWAVHEQRPNAAAYLAEIP